MLLPLAASAEVFESNGIWYNKQYHSDENVTLEVVASQGVPYSGDITIPQAVYAGEGTTNSKVTSIGKSAFEGCADLTSITLPSTLESIGEGAFYGCSGLTYVKIPNGVTKICSGAFSCCTNLNCVIISNSVTDIESYAFDYCPNLNCIISESEQPAPFNNTVFDTHDDSYDVYSMATVVIPDGARDTYQSTLGWRNFSNISEVSDASGLKLKVRIHVANAGTLPNLISDMEKYQIEELTLIGEINGKDLRLLREMAGRTRALVGYNYNLASETSGRLSILDISDVKIVEGDYYATNESATSDYDYYYLEEDNTLPTYVFYGCSRLSSIILPKNLKKIGSYAFSGTGLTTIYIPKSVTSIGAFGGSSFMPRERVFIGWNHLISITVEEGNMFFDSRNNCNAIIDSNNRLIVGCKNTIIPNSVASIGSDAFSGCTGLTSMNIPYNVTSIDYGAFAGCKDLVYITLPSNSSSIGNYAFYNCSSLTDIYCRAENVPSASDNSFSNPWNITLYAPSASLNSYKSTEPWSKFKVYYSLNNNDSQNQEKCSMPSISIIDGKAVFSCEMSGVNYHWSISTSNGTNGSSYSSSINLPITLNVYATKDGYLNSDVATYEFPGLVGDLNGDDKVDVADHVELSKIIMETE